MNVRPLLNTISALVEKREWAGVRPFLTAVLVWISSGLPFSLIVGTLTIRMAQYGVSMASLSFFSLAGLPYSVKFIIAPLVDNVRLPFAKYLGRRRSWMLAAQTALFIAIVTLGLLNPAANTLALFVAAFFVCLFAALNDVVIDAYRTESTPDTMLGLASSAAVIGYRIGMLLSGGLLLVFVGLLPVGDLSERWSIAYTMAGALVFVGFISSWLQPEKSPDIEHAPFELKSFIRLSIIEPLAQLRQINGWATILFFIATYRLSDAFHGFLFNPFLIDIGFTLESIGFVVKTVGFMATISGGLIGGLVFYRFGARSSLFWCGISELLANTMSIVQAYYGPELKLLYFTVVIEDLAQGACSACLVGYVSSVCKSTRSVATQFALLTSIASLARVTCPVIGSGYIAERWGWITFFIVSMTLALPALYVLRCTPHIRDGKDCNFYQ
jgi:PAT family beta-lactamase induction signal transducer AmpG